MDNELTDIKLKLKQGVYYILVALLSITALIVFPMLDSSSLTFKDAFPSTPTGWAIWAIERTLIVVMNLLILTLFVKQARVNVKENENFKKANEILASFKPKEYKPISPAQYYSKLYARKGITLAITTLASLIAIGDAIINYNYLLLIATAVTILFAIVFGVISMKDTELYLSTDFLSWAESVKAFKALESVANTQKEKKCLKSTDTNSETCKNKSKRTKTILSQSSTNKEP